MTMVGIDSVPISYRSVTRFCYDVELIWDGVITMSKIWQHISLGVSSNWNWTLHWIDSSDMFDWSIIFVVLVAIGTLCMRGYKAQL